MTSHKMLFKKRNEEEDKRALLKELDNLRTIFYISGIYVEFVLQYTGKQIWCIGPKLCASKQKA